MSEFDTTIREFIDGLGWPAYGFVRLTAAIVFGGLVGLEREVRGRQAGFRTNMLVCVGCAIVMLVSVQIAYVNWPADSNIQLDPARIAYGVMTGVGFLGAGVIVRHHGDVHGLTTAAGIWTVAAIGLASGLGLYLFAAVATLITLLVLWLLDYVERFLPRTHWRAVTLRRGWEPNCAAATVEQIRELGYSVKDWSFERTSDLSTVEIVVVVGFNKKQHFDTLAAQLSNARLEVVAVAHG